MCSLGSFGTHNIAQESDENKSCLMDFSRQSENGLQVIDLIVIYNLFRLK